MAYWQTGADERERFTKVGDTARLLYIDAGSWAMEQYYKKRNLPDEWFIPDPLVRDWGKRHAARALVREGIWESTKRDGRAGFTYVWIRFENTPRYLDRVRQDVSGHVIPPV